MKNKSKEKIEVKKKMRKLIKQINYHDNLYYKKNYQVISDQEYDELRKDLINLELKYPEETFNNSPNKKVGKLDSQNFKTFKHKAPMLSLNNAYEKNEVKNFYLKFLHYKRSSIMKFFKLPQKFLKFYQILHFKIN